MYSLDLCLVEAALRQQRAGNRAQRQQEQQHQRGAHRRQRAPGVANEREQTQNPQTPFWGFCVCSRSLNRQPHVADERVAHPRDEVVPHAGDQRGPDQDQQHAAEDLDRAGCAGAASPGPARPAPNQRPAARTGFPARGSRRSPAARRGRRWRRRWPTRPRSPRSASGPGTASSRARTPRRAAARRRSSTAAAARTGCPAAAAGMKPDEHQAHQDGDHAADALQQKLIGDQRAWSCPAPRRCRARTPR